MLLRPTDPLQPPPRHGRHYFSTLSSTSSMATSKQHQQLHQQRRRNVCHDVSIILMSLLGLYLFSSSFFLAKRSLTQRSECNEAQSLLETYLHLSPLEIDQMIQSGLLLTPTPTSSPSRRRNGCWMPRRADSVIVLVVDALRFDFAQHRLPLSMGSRLLPVVAPVQPTTTESKTNNNNTTTTTTTTTSDAIQQNNRRTGRSQLLQFVADPPTVTMQRLKGLTTGGLPTFADISSNFGGAALDEDSWVHQLLSTPYLQRGLSQPSRLGFVGDDTWVDLFPTQFQYSYPYPSFNTRDLDTVDNGCLEHLPMLLRKLRTKSTESSTANIMDASNKDSNPETDKDLEMLVVHFLGVDHVGHTYGPHNVHMAQKLHQMDQALSAVLDQMDHPSGNSEGPEEQDYDPTCQVCFIFGDHGMTEDGNHGGGTEEEINAALFVHVSPGCGPSMLSQGLLHQGMQDSSNEQMLLTDVIGSVGETAYASIHQIDLVATISMLLGLPIPYANLGGLVPSLLPNMTAAHTATALALNAAQVWRYYTVYSKTAQKLPHLSELQEQLDEAILTFQQALKLSASASDGTDTLDATLYHKAAALFKIFLLEATELGKRIWTRFDNVGMIAGGVVLFVALIIATWSLFGVQSQEAASPATSMLSCFQPIQYAPLETGLTVLFMTFHCALLSFSNSYIDTEQHVVIFMLAVLGIAVYLRRASHSSATKDCEKRTQSNSFLPTGAALVIPICARAGELVVSGHGLDPSLQAHFAHNAAVFLTSLAILSLIRWKVQKTIATSVTHLWMDLATLSTLALSWWEKHVPDPNRNGFLWCRLAYLLITAGFVLSIHRLWRTDKTSALSSETIDSTTTIFFKLVMAIMAVTGPSTAPSVVLFLAQLTAFWILLQPSNIPANDLSSPVAAALWRLIIRNIFFITGHACAFNRLQFSAAFVATVEFHFVMSGTALFLNTFGWEIAGNLLMWSFAKCTDRPSMWKWYSWYQLVETLCSCISVSLLRRHLMVWAIYAPRFLFVGIFFILNLTGQLLACFMD